MLVSLLLSLPLFFSLLSFPPPYPSLLTEAPFLLLYPLASLYKSFAPVSAPLAAIFILLFLPFHLSRCQSECLHYERNWASRCSLRI